MLTIKCWHAKNGHTVTQPKDFVLSSYRTGGWRVGGGSDPEKLQGSKMWWCCAGSTIWARGVEGILFFFFLNWDMFPRGRNVRDHKIKDSASKVLQGAVKECFGWRLVQASSHFQPPLRENAPGETTKSERAVFKSPHSRRPGCGLVTVKSSAAIPKISPPPPGTGTRCKTSSGGFRRENPTVERHDWDVKGVKYIRIRKRKRRKRPGWEWLRGRELRLNRQNHPHRRTKWNADHQSSHKKPHLLEIQRWDAHLP